jgi:hypothetical protein
MSSAPEAFHDDDIHEPRALDIGERSPVLTPLFELVRGDGYRWASLDVADLDPPTPVLPCAVD